MITFIKTRFRSCQQIEQTKHVQFCSPFFSLPNICAAGHITPDQSLIFYIFRNVPCDDFATAKKHLYLPLRDSFHYALPL